MLQPRYLFTQDFSVFRTALLSLPHRVRRFERGESLWAAGTPFEKIFFFDSGLARTSIISVSGSNRVIAWQGPGTMFPVIHRNRFEIETRHLTEAVTAVAALEFSAVDPENRGIYTQSDSPKKSSRNIWSLAVVSVDQRY